jgi:DNA helicase-2/ATP-dependent DNA helicase PcrA
MEFVADLHIHSRFSRATSRDLDLPHLWVWAQRKGVTVVGTGDFTHPGWFAELERDLVPAEEGLYRLRPEQERALQERVPPACRGKVRFLLSVEISNIYKVGDRTRKVHNLICAPTLEAAAGLGRALARIGNLRSDGRPILGLDSRDLLEITLESAPGAVLIPAHIWTPWFSALGSKSGFDSIEACYRDLAGEIFAVETGLSSDPPMNWRLSALDRYALVSHSDAHSPARLGREADLFDCELSYPAMFEALRHPGRGGFSGTIEFFPEEGKYHLDGHRKCNVRLTPGETRALDGLCPQCGKPVVLGVMYRVEQLADRPQGSRPEGAPPFVSLVGLSEVLGEVLGVGPGSKRVARAATALLERLGPELRVLREVPVEELRPLGGALLAEGIRRMRAGELSLDGGYDGEYGRVHLFSGDEERELLGGQTALFAISAPRRPARKRRQPATVETTSARNKSAAPGRTVEDAASDHPGLRAAEPAAGETLSLFAAAGPAADPLQGLNEAQRQAAAHAGSPVVIVAGPGTGKTRTLTRRIARRVWQGADPATVLAVTFTNKAAAELRERLQALLGHGPGGRVRVSTFHALALAMLNDWRRQVQDQPPLQVLGEEQREELLAGLLAGRPRRERVRAAREVARAAEGEDPDPPSDLVSRYRQALAERGAADLSWLVRDALDLLEQDPVHLARWRGRCRVVCVDEYQDLNRHQVRLVRLLCPQGADLCVIGDPDQAIYGFRGADPAYFLRFCEDYPGARQVALEQSYRSGRALLQAAQGLIAHAPDRPQMRTWSERTGAPTVLACDCATAAAEAEYVVHSVEQLVGGTTFFSLDSGRLEGAEEPGRELTFGDLAVLFRTGAQAEALVEAFERSSIPYTCSARLRGAEALQPVLEALRQAAGEQPPLPGLADRPPREVLERLVRQRCPEAGQDLALQQVAQLCAQLPGAVPGPPAPGGWIPVVLALAATLTEADALDERAEAVSLLTLHASKGLEFPVVFVTGCEEGLLPLRREDDEDPRQRVAEERRLLYVGMTRARERLVLTRARKRRVHGRATEPAPSRFLSEIPQALLSSTRPRPLPPGRRKNQLSLF